MMAGERFTLSPGPGSPIYTIRAMVGDRPSLVVDQDGSPVKCAEIARLNGLSYFVHPLPSPKGGGA
jgi:hypothetical protein